MPPSTEIVGAAAAIITSLCWLPQILKIIRERQTTGISLVTNAVFAAGVFLWLIYGILIGAWPVIAANIVTLVFVIAIVLLKLRYG